MINATDVDDMTRRELAIEVEQFRKRVARLEFEVQLLMRDARIQAEIRANNKRIAAEEETREIELDDALNQMREDDAIWGKEQS